MRLYYTHETCPLSDTNLKKCLLGTGDTIISKEKWVVPHFNTQDPNVRLRDNDLDVYFADSIIQELELQKTFSLGVILLVDKALAITIESEFTEDPTEIEEYLIQGLSTPFLCVIISTHGLDTDDYLKVAMHEFGHYYGLGHCENECCMQHWERNNTMQLLLIPPKLCIPCQRKLKTSLEV